MEVHCTSAWWSVQIHNQEKPKVMMGGGHVLIARFGVLLSAHEDVALYFVRSCNLAIFKTIICGLRGWWHSSSAMLAWLSGAAPVMHLSKVTQCWLDGVLFVGWSSALRHGSFADLTIMSHFDHCWGVCHFQSSLQTIFQGGFDGRQGNVPANFQLNRRSPTCT